MSADAQTTAARRRAITAQIQMEMGIEESMIEPLVLGFYTKIRDDDVLGSIIAARVEGWEPHLQKMFAFWSSVALMSGRYHGQAFAAVRRCAAFRSLADAFAETDRQVCPPAAAQRFILLSHRVAESL